MTDISILVHSNRRTPLSKTTPESMSAVPFKIAIPDADIKELQAKLRHSRLHEPLEGVGWEYGMHHDIMKEFVDYWANTFDWRKQVTYSAPSCPLTCR